MKCCPCCKVEKERTEFHKNRSRHDGLAHHCKPCRLAQEKARKALQPKKPKKTTHRFNGEVEQKRCSKCLEWKVLQGFSKCRSAPDGLQHRCRPCQSSLALQWNRENRDRYRQNDIARYWRDKEKRNKLSRVCRLRNIEQRRHSDREYNRKRYAENPAYCYEKTKRWMDRNPEKVKAKRDRANAARRARVAGAVGSHTEQDRKDLCASYLHRCAYCNESELASHLDHVTPLARGGCNHAENLVPACSFCNQSKGDSSLLEFMFNRATRAGLL